MKTKKIVINKTLTRQENLYPKSKTTKALKAAEKLSKNGDKIIINKSGPYWEFKKA